MAALRQDHRAALRLLPPVAPYVAMGEVPVDEVLPPVDRDDRAETIGREDLANRGEERRVAQHVRDLQEAPVGLGRGRDLETFTGRRRDRLFEQHFVAGREQTESARAVMPLECRVDERRRERRSAGNLFPAPELAFGRYPVRVREPRAPPVVGFDDGDEFRLVGIALGECPVGEMAPIARPDHHEFDWPHARRLAGAGHSTLAMA